MIRSIQCLCLLLLPIFLMGQNKLYPDQLKDEAVLLKKKKVKMVEVYSTIGSGEEMLIETRNYLLTGLPVEIKAWDEYEELFIYKRFTYDLEGMLVMVSEQSEDDYIYHITEYKYSGDRLIEEQHSSADYGVYSIYYIYGSDDRIDSSYVADAEARMNAWHYSNGRLDSIEGFAIYDYDQPDEWDKVEVESFEYGKKGVLTRESFCGNYSGCYNHDYSYKKKLKVQDIVSNQDEEIYRTTFEYKKKLLIRQENKASEAFRDMKEDEVLRFEYTFY